MADVWISRKRWTCKYCNLTINDDVPSRRQHENGLRHKGNVERALKGFYRKGEQEKKEADYARSQMEKIERAAQASYANDQAKASGSGSISDATVVAAPAAPSDTSPSVEDGQASNDTKAEWRPADKLAAYSTPQSLGFEEDPELLRRQREEEQRKEQGFASQWESVAPQQQALPAFASGSSVVGGQAAQDYLHDPRQEARSFKLRERQAPTHDDEEEDGLSNIKVKKRIKLERSQDAARREDEARSRLLPTWTPVRLEPKKEKSEESAVKAEASASADVKPEKASLSPSPDVKPETGAGSESMSAAAPLIAAERSDIASVKLESGAKTSIEPAAMEARSSQAAAPVVQDEGVSGGGGAGGGGGLFKKRRAGAGAGAKKVRALV